MTSWHREAGRDCLYQGLKGSSLEWHWYAAVETWSNIVGFAASFTLLLFIGATSDAYLVCRMPDQFASPDIYISSALPALGVNGLNRASHVGIKKERSGHRNCSIFAFSICIACLYSMSVSTTGRRRRKELRHIPGFHPEIVEF